jgi:hypothetical protein
MTTNNAVNSPLSGTTGTGNFVGSTSPTLITPALGTPSALVLSNATGTQVGTTAAGNAAAGQVGEVITSAISSGSGVTIAANATADVTSISLSAGDWFVYGNIVATAFGTTPVGLAGWINTTSATPPDASLLGEIRLSTGVLNVNCGIVCPSQRINISSPTTVYLSASPLATSGNATICGNITARRVR